VIGLVAHASGERDSGHELPSRGNVDGDLAIIGLYFSDCLGEKRGDPVELDLTVERRESDFRFITAVGGRDFGDQIERAFDLLSNAGILRRYSRSGNETPVACFVHRVNHRFESCA
jgi:hypothetical protein